MLSLISKTPSISLCRIDNKYKCGSTGVRRLALYSRVRFECVLRHFCGEQRRYIFVDNGRMNARVDRWIRNLTFSVTAMPITGICSSLFIDTYDQLYCSISSQSRVMRLSLLGNQNRTEIIAGAAGVGSGANVSIGSDNGNYRSRKWIIWND